MFPVLKLAGLSAVLAAGMLTAEAPKARLASVPSEMFRDRVAPGLPAHRAAPAASVRLADATGAGSGATVERSAKGDRGIVLDPCAGQTWPYLSAACIASRDADARPRAVRTIGMPAPPEAATTTTLAKTGPGPASR